MNHAHENLYISQEFILEKEVVKLRGIKGVPYYRPHPLAHLQRTPSGDELHVKMHTRYPGEPDVPSRNLHLTPTQLRMVEDFGADVGPGAFVRRMIPGEFYLYDGSAKYTVVSSHSAWAGVESVVVTSPIETPDAGDEELYFRWCVHDCLASSDSNEIQHSQRLISHLYHRPEKS